MTFPVGTESRTPHPYAGPRPAEANALGYVVLLIGGFLVGAVGALVYRWVTK